MADTTPFDAIVEQILSGTAPAQARAAAARGALPLPRTSLVRLYIALREDEDEEISACAQQSLDGLADDEILEVVSDAACAPEVLGHYASRATRDEKVAESIVFHRAAPAAALDMLASEGNAPVLDLVMTNQERLLAQPGLLDRVANNVSLRADQRGRILELIERLMRATERKQAADARALETDEAEQTAATDDDGLDAATLLQIDVGDLFTASEIEGGDELESSEDETIRDAYRRIVKMNTAQKVVLALRGNREERMILVRDTNKLVALGVLRNGRITEDDIATIARLRSVTGDILRVIGQNRDWVKKYAVIVSLANNPRTPPSTAMNFVQRLQNQDLKKLHKSHDVPELIRRMAKRTLDTRTKQSPGFKKR